jgi:hypothetical protein
MSSLELVLSRLPDAKKHEGGCWSTRCPAHDDRKASLSITEGDKRPVVFKCFADCSYEAILRPLGLDPRDFKPEQEPRSHGKKSADSKRPITLKDFARDKALPIKFLTSLGLHDVPGGGVGIPYYDETGTLRHVKRRTALKAPKGVFGPRASRSCPMALRLSPTPARRAMRWFLRGKPTD